MLENKSMEEAKNAIPKGVRKRLGFIWDKALSKTTERTIADTKPIPIGNVSIKLNRAISKTLGKDVNAKKQNITLWQTRHIDKRHGVGKEKYPDQREVTKEIFMLILDVLENFDTVEKGKGTWINEVKPSILISKHYSDGTIIVANAIIDKNTLWIKTMVVKKPTEVSPRAAKALPGSLLSPSPADLTAPNEPALPSQGTKSVTNNIQIFQEKTKNS
jgi:hypothetical protein